MLERKRERQNLDLVRIKFKLVNDMEKFENDMKKIIITLLLMVFVFSLCGCNKNTTVENESKQVAVTFVQDGVENILFTLYKGEGLNTIPNPTAKEGYSVVWDRSDFSNVWTNIIVNAVYTPNEYQITYELNNEKATISHFIQKIKYNTNYTLLIPSCEGFTFVCWMIKNSNIVFESGKWNYTKDMILVAQWKENAPWTPYL